jgi:lipopolysaccharide/colanic/teichoic acid biosynthesis glycosyltransferase
MKSQNVGLYKTMESSKTSMPRWKRVLDFAIIAAFLPGVVIVGTAVAVVVKCGSRGPIFFRQRRVGHKGNEFTCYKFRTMHVNADTGSHREHARELIHSQTPMVKLDAKQDPRVIPFGKALRMTGLDELPQLINVVRGEMSLVGPRPCIPYEYELYEPWQRRRFDAVPGLTGLWQVSGKNRTTFNEMIQLDIEYSERASLWLDAQIILKTLPALWTQCLDARARKQKSPATPATGMEKSIQFYQL